VKAVLVRNCFCGARIFRCYGIPRTRAAAPLSGAIGTLSVPRSQGSAKTIANQCLRLEKGGKRQIIPDNLFAAGSLPAASIFSQARGLWQASAKWTTAGKMPQKDYPG